MKAIVIGATGSTGKFLVDELLSNADYTNIEIFVRKPTGMENPKLKEHVIDFSKINNYKDIIVGDIIFSCLGTTLKAAGSKENQRKIDFDIPVTFAGLAKENGVSSFVLLSSYGASSQSKVFYSQLKGKLEEKISELNFEQYIIFRPGLLLRPGTNRFAEKVMVKMLNAVNAVGLFTKFKPLPTNVLARKLAKAPKVLPNAKVVIELKEIFSF